MAPRKMAPKKVSKYYESGCRSFKVRMHLDFFEMIFLIYEHCLSQVSSKWHFNQTWSFSLAYKNFSQDPAIKPSNISICFLKNILKS